ncbi:MAG: AAA family ATPase [Bacteroidetes bacterium]|nr:MAG: AAA family ATPase [Bacteroidota bacterium]
MSLRQRIERLTEGLCTGLYEREEAMKLSLLSAVAGESIFLLGPPGVGKSLIARRLKYAFRDGTSFEYLMSRFSTPDEIFGPVSIKKLKEEDKYERLTEKYLPGANIVFLDEIWKAGPAIQNALLTILNEKVYRNGEQEVQVDIKGIIAASNELPPSQESFLPLWDRFLIRCQIEGVRDQRNFLRLITDTQDVYEDTIAPELKITHAELQAWSREIDQVAMPPEVLNTLQVIRAKLEDNSRNPQRENEPFQVYDRRWKKIVRLLRTSAFLNGRTQTDLMDCFLAIPCLWSRPSQVEEVREIVSETIRKHGYSIAINLGMLRREVEDFEKEVSEETRIRRIIAEDRLEPVKQEYYQFMQGEKQFQGELIKIEEFNRLDTQELQVINIYDEEQVLRHRLKARKSQREHAVEIVYNAVEFTCPLRTHKAERTEVILKKPHPLVARHWDEKVAQLQEYIRQQQQRLSAELPEELGHPDHLFTDPRLAKIVRANQEEVAVSLHQLLLRIEKAQYAYASI